MSFRSYIRLKIFTDRGKDKYGRVQIPYAGKSTVFAVTGRTIRPDGSVIELSKDAIFDRVIVKKNGQLMQGRLLVFNPSILQPDRRIFPVNETRAEPIVLRAETYRKHVRIKLPAGFTVDELPQAVKQHSEWGEFSLTFEQKAGELVMEEDLKIDAVTLPPDHYKEVKKFFDQFSGADQQQAVLVKN